MRLIIPNWPPVPLLGAVIEARRIALMPFSHIEMLTV
jgi:hypothetical protein